MSRTGQPHGRSKELKLDLSKPLPLTGAVAWHEAGSFVTMTAEPGEREANDDPDPDKTPVEEDDDDEGDDEGEEEDEEPELKYSRLTGRLGGVYRNGDATSAFLSAGDKMVASIVPACCICEVVTS